MLPNTPFTELLCNKKHNAASVKDYGHNLDHE
jgi:hypothetical protein